MKTQFIILMFILTAFAGKIQANTAAASFTFVPPCMPFAMITAVPNMPGCFTFSATNGGVNDPNGYYAWNFGNGNTTTGNPVTHCFTPGPQASDFTVSVTYNSTLSCGSTPMEQKYVVNVDPAAPTGIRESAGNRAGARLFPNPAEDQIFVDTPKQVSAIMVFDQTGKLRERRTINRSGQITFQVADYSAGMYIVKLISTDASEINLKFIKK